MTPFVLDVQGFKSFSGEVFLETLPPPPPPSNLYRIRPWGDPVMVKYGFDIANINTTNFQAVKTWNKVTGWGAVTNFLRIDRRGYDYIQYIRNIQFDQIWEGRFFDQDSKMNWLCKYRGTIYMYDNPDDDWKTAPSIRWGTVSVGGNLVQVEGIEALPVRWENQPLEIWQMARLRGFQKPDVFRPLADLLASGLVHQCYCVYGDNRLGETPKGVIYSPFWSPLDWDFAGTGQPDYLYLPLEWLIKV